MRTTTLSAAVLFGCAAAANANLIASDSFVTGSTPATTYTDNAALQGQTPAETGFSSAGWASGIGTSNFITTSSGLQNGGGSDAASGKVNWIGASTSASRSIARNLSTAQGSSTFVYYTAQLLSRGSDSTTAPTTGSFVGLGYANSTFPVSGTTTGNQTGFYVGFSQLDSTDQGSLVVRTRTTAATADADTTLIDGRTTSTANTTYLVITKAETNYSGGSTDQITVWVNPTDTSSEAAMTASSLYTNAASPLQNFALQGTTADLVRLNFAAAGAFAPTAYFDETRLGTSLTDVVPEPASLASLAGLSLLMARRRRA